MAFKRLLIEFGQGVDMHGGDQNNAVLKAVKDAVHHCCMAGLFEVFDIKNLKAEAKIHADIYVPHAGQTREESHSLRSRRPKSPLLSLC